MNALAVGSSELAGRWNVNCGKIRRKAEVRRYEWLPSRRSLPNGMFRNTNESLHTRRGRECRVRRVTIKVRTFYSPICTKREIGHVCNGRAYEKTTAGRGPTNSGGLLHARTKGPRKKRGIGRRGNDRTGDGGTRMVRRLRRGTRVRRRLA